MREEAVVGAVIDAVGVDRSTRQAKLAGLLVLPARSIAVTVNVCVAEVKAG